MNEAVLFGRLLREVRKSRKMSLSELGDKVEIGAKHLGRIERGEKQPSFDLIIALANALNSSPATFFQFENANLDSKLVREQIRRFLQHTDHNRLLKAYRLLQIISEN